MAELPIINAKYDILHVHNVQTEVNYIEHNVPIVTQILMGHQENVYDYLVNMIRTLLTI